MTPGASPAPLQDDIEHPHKIALVLDPGGSKISEQVQSGVIKAGELLRNAGYTVDEINPPELEEAADIWLTICLGEVVTGLKPAVQDICGPRLLRCLEYYSAMLPDDFSAASMLDAHVRRQGVLRKWAEFFLDYPLIVGPVGTQPPFLRDADLASLEANRAVVDSQRLTVSVNALNLPAATVPVGVSGGLPQAVQIIGPQFSEMCCLSAAAAIENQVGPLTPIDPRW